MARIVGAFAVSHAAVMIRTWERAPAARREAVRAGYDEVARLLRAAAPDVLLMVGSDHFQSFFLDNMPAFCIGVGERSVGWGDGGLRRFELEVDGVLAQRLLEGLVDVGFDLAFARDLPLDHAFMSPLHMIMPDTSLPVVPLFQNCVAPPLPTVRRCLELGAALRTILDAEDSDLRVAVLGTGGLSHQVPLADWRTLSDDASGQLWRDFMSLGRHRADPELQQRVGAEVLRWGREGLGRIAEDFDAEVLDLLARGDHAGLAALQHDVIEARGGNGAQEIRNWATVAGMVPECRARTLFYQPVSEWLTGIAGVAFEASRGPARA